MRYLDAAAGIPWSSGLVAFLRTNTQGLLILVGVALIVEFIGVEKSGLTQRQSELALKEFQEAVLEGAGASFLTRMGYQRVIGRPGSEEVVEGMLLEKPVMRDVHVRVEARPSVSAKQVLLTHDLEFDWAADEVVLALVQRQDDVARIVRFLDGVVETRVQINPDYSLERIRISKDWVSLNPFRVYANHAWSPLRLSLVPRGRALEMRRNVGLEDDEVLFLRGQLPGGGRVSIRNVQEQDPEISYTWWLADRLIEVKSLVVDVSAISKESSAELLPFWASKSVMPATPQSGRWEYRDLGWVLPGNGFCVHWGMAVVEPDLNNPEESKGGKNEKS